jgi:hypothetical protein
LAVGRKTWDKNPSIHIQNFDLTCESTVKLLGIDIDYQLNFDAHISTIKVITKLPNSEQSYKGKVKTHNYINRQNQSTTGKL